MVKSQATRWQTYSFNTSVSMRRFPADGLDMIAYFSHLGLCTIASVKIMVDELDVMIRGFSRLVLGAISK